MRISQAEVRQVVDTDASLDITPFIEIANAVTDRVNTAATSKGYTLTAVELRSIEKLLAAHYYTARDPQYKSRRTERAAGEFLVKDYLELAKQVDPSNSVGAIVSGFTSGMQWLGKAPSDQVDYVDRD